MFYCRGRWEWRALLWLCRRRTDGGRLDLRRRGLGTWGRSGKGELGAGFGATSNCRPYLILVWVWTVVKFAT